MTRIMPMAVTSKLIIINTCWAALVVWAAINGYVELITRADGVHMTWVIAALFAAGLASTFRLAWRVDNASRVFVNERRTSFIATSRDSAHLYDIRTALFILGIIGNAAGFLLAFGGIDTSAVTTAEGAQRAGAQLLSGVGTAFGSTITGLTLALWLMSNLRPLATAIERLSP